MGFTRDDVGLHSTRSGGAMSMFLSGVFEITIQQIARWESFAFLEYIREQVENFTYGVSRKMLDKKKFHYLNDKNLPRNDIMNYIEFEPTYDEGEGVSSGTLFTNYLQKGPGREYDPFKS